MKWFHSITVSVFIKPEENYDMLKQKFILLFPFSLEDAKIAIKETCVSSFEDRILRILEIKLTKESLINQLMKSILDKLSHDDVSMMLQQLPTRVDAESNFFFRLSKIKLIDENCYIIVDDGNCYHFKCYVAAYPQNKEKAMETVSKFLSLKNSLNES
jgi:RNA binding exosome subunit